jgi:hypothetical protein
MVADEVVSVLVSVAAIALSSAGADAAWGAAGEPQAARMTMARVNVANNDSRFQAVPLVECMKRFKESSYMKW